ncbi:MAG: GAF domain-containing protein, partial [Oscillospiraceae bacterium]|nr:GAF domain-containing protein [Oscillospiraceae bacterium]
MAEEFRDENGSADLQQLLFEANPYINMVFDSQFRIIDCNPAAVEFFGFASKQEVMEKAGQIILQSIPPVQPTGEASVSLADRFKHTIRHGYNDFETLLVLDNQEIPMRIIMKRIPHGGSFAIALYQIDLRKLKAAREELLIQDRLLKAANTVASLLLATSHDDFSRAIMKSLEILGESIDVDRAYFWKNTLENGKLCCTQVAEWAREKASEHDDHPAVDIAYDDFIPNWKQLLEEMPCVNVVVRDMDMGFVSFPGMQDVVSILIIPVFLRGEFWGFIGFDDCRRERVFTPDEEDIMKSGGILIASAIARNEMTENLIKTKEMALESTKAKSEFLSRMSHEIRTPMNAIIGMTTIAKKAGDQEKVNYCLNKIDNASRQLLGIINDVLDMSKIEANKFEITPDEFDFESMMQNVFNVIQVRVEEKHQHFTCHFMDMFTRYVVSDELR